MITNSAASRHGQLDAVTSAVLVHTELGIEQDTLM